MKYTIILLLIVASLSAFAQESQHPIDVAYDKCLSSAEGQTTSGSIECARAAGVKWDAELNKNYKLLIGLLSPEEQAKLRASQRSWIAFRDSEIEYVNALYGGMRGSMWYSAAADRATNITRQRALELKHYYDNKNDN